MTVGVSNAFYINMVIAPDSSAIAYVGDAIYEIPITGGNPKAISSSRAILFSPDHKWILSSGDGGMDYHPLDVKSLLTDKSVFSAERVAPIFASDFDPVDNSIGWGRRALFSLNSLYFVYFAAEDKNSTIPNLYSVELNSGKSTKLNMLPGSKRFHDQQFRITADSSMVVYSNDEEVENFIDLYAVPITGGNVTRLTPDESKGVIDFQLYPLGTSWKTDFPEYYS